MAPKCFVCGTSKCTIACVTCGKCGLCANHISGQYQLFANDECLNCHNLKTYLDSPTSEGEELKEGMNPLNYIPQYIGQNPYVAAFAHLSIDEKLEARVIVKRDFRSKGINHPDELRTSFVDNDDAKAISVVATLTLLQKNSDTSKQAAKSLNSLKHKGIPKLKWKKLLRSTKGGGFQKAKLHLQHIVRMYDSEPQAPPHQFALLCIHVMEYFRKMISHSVGFAGTSSSDKVNHGDKLSIGEARAAELSYLFIRSLSKDIKCKRVDTPDMIAEHMGFGLFFNRHLTYAMASALVSLPEFTDTNNSAGNTNKHGDKAVSIAEFNQMKGELTALKKQVQGLARECTGEEKRRKTHE